MDRVAFNNLVAKAIAGDKDALNAVITESFEDIHFYARKLLKDEDLAADAAQSSCEEIIKTIGNLKESAAFVTWSRRIIYHHCLAHTGHTQEVPYDTDEDGEPLMDRLPDETPGSLPEEVVQNHELRDLLQDMINNLSEGQRSAILLYHYQHYSIQEIALIQDENENTIKSRLHQGRKAVRKQVEAYEKKTGIKLHSIGIAPLLYFLLQAGKEESDLASAALLPKVQAALAPVIAKVSAGAGSVTAGAAITSTLGFKIGAGLLAAALVVGGVIIATQPGNEPDEGPASPNISYSEPSQPVDPVPPASDPNNSHPFQHYAFDNDAHWLICDCPDATSTRYAHRFADDECIDCRMPEPLPGGNPLLTYDCTTLSGHWMYMFTEVGEHAPVEFYISGDGSMLVNGQTYYPVGNRLGDTAPGEEPPILIYYRNTPFDPDVGITEVEMDRDSSYIVTIDHADDRSIISLGTNPTASGGYFDSMFYRESDYFGYEKVALTPENFRDYVTVTIDPLGCAYYSGVGFHSYTGIQFTLREGLGNASWCQIKADVLYKQHHVTSNIKELTNEVTYVSSEGETKAMHITFIGCDYHKHIDIMLKDTVPVNDLVQWYADIPVEFEVDSITGYVFVPKQ